MIRFELADLVVVAAGVLGTDPGSVIEALDHDAAGRALADPEPPVRDPAARAGALLHGLLRHRPLPRGNRRVALIATAQFLAVNGWRLDLDAADDLVDVLRAADGPDALTTWVRRHMRPIRTPRQEAVVPARSRVFSRRDSRTSPVLGRLDERARRAVVLAREEARYHHHDHVGTEHLLLGLLHEGEGRAARALRSCQVDLAGVREVVDGTAVRARGVPARRIPLTPRALRALELSGREARLRDRPSVATEHLLLGVLGVGDGGAARVLGRLGRGLDEVRDRVLRSGG